MNRNETFVFYVPILLLLLYVSITYRKKRKIDEWLKSLEKENDELKKEKQNKKKKQWKEKQMNKYIRNVIQKKK